MYRTVVAVSVWITFAAAPGGAAQRDPLDRARTLYNQRDFEAALAAADEARRSPERADSADLIAARAYLERFRDQSAADDLVRARERLRRINPARFNERERIEFVVGLGETLYFESASGAAAAVFESVLATRGDLPSEARERVLDWWASALDQDARLRPEIDRLSIYQRIRDRMADELGANPASGAASYWAAAAARGQGDLQAAWDAAQAGWVRAPLTRDGGATLRTDIDQLVEKAIVPERSRITGQPPDTVKAEWDRFKEKWAR